MRRVDRRQASAPRGWRLAAHHTVLALVMFWMLFAGPAPGATTGAMPMRAAPGVLGALALVYVWLAVLVLGAGMVRAPAAPEVRAVPLFASPELAYACDVVMALLTGLMLLA
jgi:hypothetical protein